MKSDGDVPLSLKLATPKRVGGKGDGQNPEQLFAMGYACEFFYLILSQGDTRVLILFLACFLGALQFVASKTGKKEAAAKAKIHSSVVLGPAVEMDGFALKVNLKVEGVEDESLIKAAHEVLSLFSAPISHFSHRLVLSLLSSARIAVL